jgi:heme/copper-type cytochrome/quinol oxidase subunit 2
MNPKRPWFWFWMAWLGIFVGAETWALVDTDRGDTLSESVWFLQRSFWPLTALLVILLVFLFVHFILDRRSRKRVDERTRNL